MSARPNRRTAAQERGLVVALPPFGLDAGPPADLAIRPQGEFIAAEIDGVDLATPPDAATKALLRRTLATYGVFVLRDQTLSSRQLVDYAAVFGPPLAAASSSTGATMLPGWPELEVVSNVAWGGTARDALAAGDDGWRGGLDAAAHEGGVCLYAIEAAEDAGALAFVSAFEAYQRLPEGLKAKARDLSVLRGARPGGSAVPAGRPLVLVDPETGRAALQLGDLRGARIAGLSAAAAERLIDELWEYGVGASAVWHHRLTAGDVLHWDPRFVLVRAAPAAGRFILWRARHGL